jgi:ATP-dependent protease ClpP protease subunit
MNHGTHGVLDASVMARVWALLNARDAKPRPTRAEAPALRAQAATADAPAELLIYDEIGFWGICAIDVVAALGGLGDGDLHVRVNSPGGDVFDGIAIHNALLAHPGTVTVTVDGLAASAASLISMAGDRVIMSRASQMMVHDASGLAIGNAADMTSMAELLDKISDMIAGVYADRAGGEVAAWRDIMRAETWYAPAEAVAAGLADAMPDKPGQGDDEGAKPDTDEDVDEDTGQDKPKRKPAMTSWDLTGFRYPGRPAAPAPVDQVGAQPVDTAVGSHDTAVKDGTWDASAEQGKLPSPMPVAVAKAMYGAYDEDAVEDGKLPKAAGHLPHHFVSADGTPGAASVNGVRNALSRLPQTHGLSDAERATVEKHLNGHLDKFNGGDTDGADDAWASEIAHLTHTDRADDEFAQLMEAL